MKCGRSRDTYQEPQALRSALLVPIAIGELKRDLMSQ